MVRRTEPSSPRKTGPRLSAILYVIANSFLQNEFFMVSYPPRVFHAMSNYRVLMQRPVPLT